MRSIRTARVKAFACVVLLVMAAGPLLAQPGGGRAKTNTYTLTINCNVQNAQVFINAIVQKGSPPMNVRLSEGRYNIVVRAAGYRDYNTSISLASDMTINVSLQALTNQLSVTSNVHNASVYINGQLQGTVPLAINLQAGRYAITVKAEGYSDYNTTLSVDRNMSIMAALQPASSVLSITSNVPGAQVEVNGNLVGQTPIRVQLDNGRYNVQVSADGYYSAVQSVSLSRDLTISVTLQPAMARFHLRVNAKYLNTGVRNPLSLFTVYVDNQVQQGLNFEVPAGRHLIRVVTGGLVMEGDFDVVAGAEYTLEPGYDLRLARTDRPQGR